jgi:hypothetical protein
MQKLSRKERAPIQFLSLLKAPGLLWCANTKKKKMKINNNLSKSNLQLSMRNGTSGAFMKIRTKRLSLALVSLYKK